MSFHYDDEDSDLPTIKRIVLPASLDLSSFMPKKSRGKVDEQPSVNSSKTEQPSLPKGAELRGKNATKRKISSRIKSSKLNLDNATIQVTQRLQEINFLLSPSQPITPKDGNCFIHAIIDQLTYDSVWKRAKLTVLQLRERVTASLLNLMFRTPNFEKQWDKNAAKTPESWIQIQSTDGEYVDHYFIELWTKFLNRRIIIHPVHEEQGWKDGQMIVHKSQTTQK